MVDVVRHAGFICQSASLFIEGRDLVQVLLGQPRRCCAKDSGPPFGGVGSISRCILYTVAARSLFDPIWVAEFPLLSRSAVPLAVLCSPSS